MDPERPWQELLGATGTRGSTLKHDTYGSATGTADLTQSRSSSEAS
jgi:hypothetical protein